MKQHIPHAFSDLRWHRLCVTLMNIRVSPEMSSHPLSVFQAIFKGVSLLAPSMFPGMESLPAGETPEDTPKNNGMHDGTPSPDTETEGLPVFHIKGRKHTWAIKKNAHIPLEILFFQKSEACVQKWREAFLAYLSDPETGKNFEIVELGPVEIRSFEHLVSGSAPTAAEGEICLEFLTPLPFKAVKGKSHTCISPDSFTRLFERRMSRLFGKKIAYHPGDDRFSLLPYYWNYTEIRRVSSSQPGQIQYVNGCAGKLYIKGRFQHFFPFLLLGSEVHVGRRLAHAQGYYIIHRESPGYFQGHFPDKKVIVSVIRDVMNRYDLALQSLTETEGFPFEEDAYAEKIFHAIVSHTYEPSPNTAFMIKKKGGADRMVEQVPFADLIVQQYVLKTISTVFDRIFEEESLGFRKGISRKQSISMVQSAIQEGYGYVIESDIEDFFSSIDLTILEDLIDHYLPQKDAGLKQFLLKTIRSGYLLNGNYHERKKGLAQGSPLSPLLANLYLDAFDEQIKGWGRGRQEERDGAEGKDDAGEGGQEKRMGNADGSREMAGAGGVKRDVKMIRYADDFIILTKSEEDARDILSDTESYLTTLGLKLKKEKTAITSIGKGFQFLGMRFEKTAVVLEEEEIKLLKKPLYITEPYLFLSLNGDAIDICKNRKIIETLPLRRISEIMVMERAVFSTALLRKCTERNIPLSIALNTGYYITTIKPDSKQYYIVSHEHSKKYAALSETEILCIAKEFAAGKLKNYIPLLKQRYEKEMHLCIRELEDMAQQMNQAGTIQQVRGIEGAMAKKIYQQLNGFIGQPGFRLEKRQRTKPDRINALLNFGYYLLFSRINATVRALGLNPYLGFLHSPQDNYESLVCDIEELFRSKTDRFVLRLVNLKIIDKGDFVETEKGFSLGKEAVKKFLSHFEEEMEKKGTGAALTLKENIYVQVSILKKWVLENKPLSFYLWQE